MVCLFIYLFIYFLAVLGLRFCARVFSSCGKRGPLFIVVRGPLTVAASRCGAQAPDAQAQQLWLTGLVAPRHVGSSQTRARTRVPCTGRRILHHCATREAPTNRVLIPMIIFVDQVVLMHHVTLTEVLRQLEGPEPGIACWTPAGSSAGVVD